MYILKERSKITHPVYRVSHKPDLQRIPEGKPIYFSDEPRIGPFGKYVIKAYINIRKPFLSEPEEVERIVNELPSNTIKQLTQGIDIDEFDDPREIIIEELWHDNLLYQHPKILPIIQQEYDGIIGDDSFGGQTEYIVFSPDQVRVLEEYYT